MFVQHLYTEGFRIPHRTFLTLRMVIVHKMSDWRRRVDNWTSTDPALLLVRLKSVSALVCSEGKQCDVPSNEFVWLKGLACIDGVVTVEFATA